jgi:hypothetical protein
MASQHTKEQMRPKAARERERYRRNYGITPKPTPSLQTDLPVFSSIPLPSRTPPTPPPAPRDEETPQFRRALAELRVYQVSQESWQFLSSRVQNELTPDEVKSFDDALRPYFCERRFVCITPVPLRLQTAYPQNQVYTYRLRRRGGRWIGSSALHLFRGQGYVNRQYLS